MSGLRCRPGDLARIVGMPYQLRGLNDRFVKLADEQPFLVEGYWSWRLAEPVETCLLGNARQGGRFYYVGETVVVEILQDEFLRPIRGTDGDDETLAWAGKPATQDRAPVEGEIVGV